MKLLWAVPPVAALVGALLVLLRLRLDSRAPASSKSAPSDNDKHATGATFRAFAILLLAVPCVLAWATRGAELSLFAATSPSANLAMLALVGSPLLMLAASVFVTPTVSRRLLAVTLFDAFVVGAAVTAAASWWLVAPRQHAVTPVARLAVPTAVLAATTWLAMAMFSEVAAPARIRIGAGAACRIGGAAFVAAGFLLLWHAHGLLTAPLAVLWAVGFLGLGCGWFLSERQGTTTIMGGVAMAATTSAGTVEFLATLLAPCLALMLGVIHAQRTAASSGIIDRWLAPVLVFAAVARFSWAWMSQNKTGRLSGYSLGQENDFLREQLARRTQQLSTLHAVSAELNNTLDCEKILLAALTRIQQSLQADAAAVWLLLGDTSIGADNGEGDAGVSNASALFREIDRGAAERRAIESLKRDRDNGDGPTSKSASLNGAGARRRWRSVREFGEVASGRHIIEQMSDQLEAGDLKSCDDFCNSMGQSGGHIAAVRCKGELIGAIGVARLQGIWEAAESALLEALALEVGVALQNALLYQEASRLADRDSLTDLLNHRALQQQLNAVLSRAKRIPTEFSVVMMDVQNFQFFNETYGHPVGDKVLRTVSHCLRDACRTSDLLCRFGGDEFMAILMDTDSAGTQEVCSRIARRLQQESFQVMGDGRRIPIGLSFGISLHPQDGVQATELLGLANSNLQESKTSGKQFVFTDKAQQSQEIRQLKSVAVGGSFGVLDALVTAIDNKDRYTRRHSEDVSNWATLMSQQLEHDQELQRAVRICGLLHDVGKIAVPDAVLRKPGRLNDDEFNIMQQHPVFGALIVKDVPNLTDVLGGIRHHHERFDGKGYPDKLKGEDIPLLGRMLAVPDCFSAMTTERPYRKALSWAEAISEIEKGRGTQFDPAQADAFLEVIAGILAEKHESLPAPDQSSNGEAVLRPRSVADAAVA